MMHFAYTIHAEFSEVLNISLFHGKSKTKEEINIQGDSNLLVKENNSSINDNTDNSLITPLLTKEKKL